MALGLGTHPLVLLPAFLEVSLLECQWTAAPWLWPNSANRSWLGALQHMWPLLMLRPGLVIRSLCLTRLSQVRSQHLYSFLIYCFHCKCRARNTILCRALLTRLSLRYMQHSASNATGTLTSGGICSQSAYVRDNLNADSTDCCRSLAKCLAITAGYDPNCISKPKLSKPKQLIWFECDPS